jgi:hypothetical protein
MKEKKQKKNVREQVSDKAWVIDDLGVIEKEDQKAVTIIKWPT